MNQYKIKVSEVIPTPKIITQSGEYGATKRYLTKSGQPWIPLMGEFHYSRYPEDEWEEELWKMKSGGIEIVASYVIWIHHEETKGAWDFEGNKNLRKFVQLCDKVGLKFWLRVGPFVHGEVRNGGFPDWLLKEVHSIRTNNAPYLQAVDSFFSQIYLQVADLFAKDGGPIIGIQVENEYGHVGGDNSEQGRQHLRLLLTFLQMIGFEVPYYTATGWGGAIWTEEMLPVYGGYIEAPWDPSTEKIDLSRNFLIQPDRDDHMIANEYNPADKSETIQVMDQDTPYLTAELGGGLQVTHHRRPKVSGMDIYGLAFTKLASGANLLGYYMYHGGTNPKGKLTTLEESKASGMYNDLPILNYDFQAPLGEYGEAHESYGMLRSLHRMIKTWETFLAESQTFFPEELVLVPEDERLRISVRHDAQNNGGMIFISNYQRQVERKAIADLEIQLALPDGDRIFSDIDVPANQTKTITYHLPIKGYLIEYSDAELNCILDDGTFVFVHEEPRQAKITFAGEVPSFMVLTPNQINHSFVHGNQLIEANGMIWQAKEQVVVAQVLEEVVLYHQNQQKQINKESIGINVFESYANDQRSEYQIQLSYKNQALDYQLEFAYEGDRAELWAGAVLIADQFAIDGIWQIKTGRFNNPSELKLIIYGPSEPVYYDIDFAPEKHQLHSVISNPVVKKALVNDPVLS